ncbi:MAG TPA: A/G-specific adenine glycosylase [Acidimicrobiales bacterium]
MPPALIASGVLAWWDGDRRDLPWRRTRDPWAVLVSEVMLQQTQVDRVIPKWTAFLDRFPDPARCAAAPVRAVIDAWAGLGYNRRGVALHRCARVVVDEHDGRLPMDLAALLALPGIGPYTARAVLAFAGEQDVAVVDTNVARVLARQAGRPLRLVEVQADADALVPSGQGWAWNQAMLDLGATVCRARAPDCGRCPVATSCAWRGGAGPDPAVGSAGVSGRQSRFEGSDRQGRGRLVDALRHGPVSDVATATGWPEDPERAERVAQTLVADGLAVRVGDTLTLP